MNPPVTSRPTVATDTIPRSVLSCFPWLWTRILFPGHPLPSAKIRWFFFLLILVLPAAALYPCLSFYLFEPDEGRYAEIPREMLSRGEWIVPYLQSEPYLDKPPLTYWLIMLSYSLLGTHDWSARLIPALSVHGCILLIYFFGRKRVGETAAFWGALILLLAPGFVGMGRLLLLDGVLKFLVTLTLLSAFEAIRGSNLSWKWWLLSALACGLGVLAKGPVILILVLIPIWLHRKLTQPTWKMGIWPVIVYLGLAFLLAFPWYVAICVRLPEFGYYFLWQHNIMRFFSPFDHIKPIWFYVPILLFGMMPATLLAIPFARFLLSGDEQKGKNRSPELGFYLLAGLWCVFFFSLSGSKLPTYILPAFPPLALALGTFVSVSRWNKSSWTRIMAGAAYAFLIVGNFWIIPWYAEYRSPMNRPEQVREFCGDPDVPVLCYPRPVDSVAFYLKRDDLRNYRSKYTHQLLEELQKHRKTVVLFSHRHSCEQLRNLLPPHMEMTKTAPLGLCSMGIVEKKIFRAR